MLAGGEGDVTRPQLFGKCDLINVKFDSEFTSRTLRTLVRFSPQLHVRLQLKNKELKSIRAFMHEIK